MTISPPSVRTTQSLYEADYFAWLETNLQKLKSQAYDSVDWENLIEEIEDIARKEKRELENSLTIVLRHLLQWQYQPKCRNQRWMTHIVAHRIQVAKLLTESPSLKPHLEKALAETYRNAVKIAIAETGFPKTTFPPKCPYAIAQILNENFLPQ